MPQKLKHTPGKFTGTGDLRFGSDAIAGRPELMVLLMQILVEWSYLELRLADSLVHVLDTQPDVGVEVFLSLEHNAAQINVVENAAEVVLDERDFGIFSAILVLARAGGRKRNIVAHGLWGTTSALPDALVLLPRKGIVRLTGPLAALGSINFQKVQTSTAGQVKVFERFLDNPTSYVDLINESPVYYLREFTEMKESIHSAASFITKFWKMRQTPPGLEQELLRRQLCDEPEIQKSLSHQSKDQTTPP